MPCCKSRRGLESTYDISAQFVAIFKTTSKSGKQNEVALIVDKIGGKLKYFGYDSVSALPAAGDRHDRAVGQLAANPKQEEMRMPAYWLARSKINDPVEYKRYTDLVPGILAKFGGKVLARGGRFQILEGPEKFKRFVVVEFPTLEQAVACHDSPEYTAAASFRRSGAGEVELVIVESGDATV